ncbi:MAG TPA: zinc-ribbon domain-containing protein [Verrucomicrobiae bacterium]|nr:zinc-ribbon domain-containing protein [Verrucomicrobiae bacterium]
MKPEECPNCGAEIPERARACPECGSCEETGWSDRAHTERLGLPDEEFDYNRFVREEFGERKPAGPRWWVAVVAALLLGLLAWRFIH